jgi:hypothetical protein
MIRIWWVLLAAITASGQSNTELLKLYNEDQKDREKGVSMTKAELDAIAGNDAGRRKRVKEMLQTGEVKTPEDYDRAAFIFQHGSEPNDYLLAHVLGMTAMALDAGPGRWIATATLDRYLKSIGKPQIFGNDLAPKTETDWNLIPELVRAANCVPSRAEHERILEAIAKNTLPETMGPCQPKEEDFNGRWSVLEKMLDGKVVQGVIDLRWKGDDLAATHEVNGRKTVLEDLSIGDRELKFRIGEREYRLKVHGGMISGSFSAPGGRAGQVVGLR